MPTECDQCKWSPKGVSPGNQGVCHKGERVWMSFKGVSRIIGIVSNDDPFASLSDEGCPHLGSPKPVEPLPLTRFERIIREEDP